MGIAFHPDFQNNRRFYVRYSSPPREGTPDDYDHTHVVSEFQASQDLSRGLIDSKRVLLESPSPQFDHNGGTITFGPDGYLYFGLGDGGDADDTGLGHVEDWYDENEGGNGQNTTENLLGGIHRIDVDSRIDDRSYGIPDDNPFADNDQGLLEYYAWGFRNAWRIGFSEVSCSRETTARTSSRRSISWSEAATTAGTSRRELTASAPRTRTNRRRTVRTRRRREIRLRRLQQERGRPAGPNPRGDSVRNGRRDGHRGDHSGRRDGCRHTGNHRGSYRDRDGY